MYIDDREDSSPSPGVESFSSRLTRLGVPCKVQRSEFSDFWFHGVDERRPHLPLVSVGVERKALYDLLGCMVSGRLAAHQVPGMRSDFDDRWLVIEGIWRGNPQTGALQRMKWNDSDPSPAGVREHVLGGRKPMPRPAPPVRGREDKWEDLVLGPKRFTLDGLENYILSLQRGSGMVVVNTRSRGETAAWLKRCWAHYQKARHSTFDGIETPCAKGMGNGAEGDEWSAPGGEQPGLVARMAAQLPGVGIGRALKAARVFPTVKALVESTAEQWERIDGIGKTTAVKVVSAMRERNAR